MNYYAIGFGFANIIWAIQSLGSKDSLFATFTLSISLIGLLWELENKKGKSRR